MTEYLVRKNAIRTKCCLTREDGFRCFQHRLRSQVHANTRLSPLGQISVEESQYGVFANAQEGTALQKRLKIARPLFRNYHVSGRRKNRHLSTQL